MWTLLQNLQIPLLWATALFGALSVVCGLISGIVGFQLSKDADREIALARADAAQANERAANADKGTAEARERAASAELKLEEYRAPRVIDDAQRQRILNAVKPYAGTHFVTGIVPGDLEAANLSVQIEDILIGAGWIVDDWSGDMIALNRGGRKTAGSATEIGLVFRFHANNPDLQNAVLAAANALHAEGFGNIKAERSVIVKPENSDKVNLIVGRKN